MQGKKLTILCQGVLACAFWICGLPMLQPAAPAQASQEQQAEESSKPKKHKKSIADEASPQAGAPTEANQSKAEKRAPVKNASETEIQDAKSSGKVWVNTDSGVYHKSGKWFGATKQGKFMTEQDAIKAGYRPAKNEK